MRNGWTGGQYSVFRVLFGAYLVVHFAMLVPYGTETFSDQGVLRDARASPLTQVFPNILAWLDSPAAITALLLAASVASVAFSIGWQDRWMAMLAWYVLACLVGRNPLISNPSLPYVGFALVAHACLPRKPFGSLDARGRGDPNGDWTFPGGIYLAAWVALFVGYGYSGLTKLASPSWIDGTAVARVLGNPLARPTGLRDWLLGLPDSVLKSATWAALALEISAPVLALFSRTRRWGWLVMLSMHLGLIALIDFADLSLGMVMFHLFTFDPGWIRGHPSPGAHAPDRVYFDARRRLDRLMVRLLIAEDIDGTRFRFAPLDGETFARHAPKNHGGELVRGLAIETGSGELLLKSEAVRRSFGRLGGLWRIIGWCGRLVPRAFSDWAYDSVARWPTPSAAPALDASPLVEARLHERFDP